VDKQGGNRDNSGDLCCGPKQTSMEREADVPQTRDEQGELRRRAKGAEGLTGISHGAGLSLAREKRDAISFFQILAKASKVA